MAYPTDGKIGTKLATTTTDPEFTLGTVTRGSDGSEWVYVQAGEAITQYMTVAIDENFQAVKVTTALAAAGHNIGSAQIAFANDDYGWVCTKAPGNVTVLVSADCAADVQLYTTSTAGVLDDTSAGVNLIRGMVLVAAATNTQSAREGILQNVSGTATA